ncbi:MAG: suppressor of fused domain protein [Stagnimonas sp.]|nr:suppressor of fused domain protein [Stagnimonas sp.]
MLRATQISLVAALAAALICVAPVSIAAESAKPESNKLMSKNTTERSESGAPIYKHGARKKPFTPPKHSTDHLDEVQTHVEKHIGKVETVFHEIVSDLIHLDVLFIPATAKQPYHVLVTSGVSDEPMKVPEGAEEFNRVELIIALPKEWPLTQESFQSENNYWPVRWLKDVGRLPHEHDTWVGWGHTIPNGDPAEPIANTKFTGVMLSPPYSLPPEFFKLKTKNGDIITFFVLTPLYQEEMDFKLKNGADSLEEKLGKHSVDFVVDTSRSNVVKKKSWFK